MRNRSRSLVVTAQPVGAGLGLGEVSNGEEGSGDESAVGEAGGAAVSA
jgi:hypothetical protein